MATTCDLAVIGSGPGGYAAALAAARRGAAVALIEREAWGGVCLNVGCIPTKAFLASAHLLRRIRHAREFGITVQGVEVDYAAVRERTEQIVATLRRGLTELLRREGVRLVQGSAAFEDQRTLRLTQDGKTERLSASHIVIATGARPIAGPWAFDEERVLSYRGLLALATLPKSLLIIGGGVIGCEFASCFAAFGAKVTIVEQQPQLLPQDDPDAVRWLARRLEADGATVVTGATVQQLAVQPGGVSATLSTGTQVSAERCLISIGQRPNLEGLQLDKAGIAAGRGIQVDQSLRTSRPHIAAIGDCLEGHGLAHWASAEGMLAARALLGEATEPLDAAEIPRCIFTTPEIAQVGPLQSQAGNVRVSRFSLAALGKSHCDGDTEGFVKLLVDPVTERITGATIVGESASQLIHYAVVAMRQGLTAKQLAQTVTAHPTMPEAVTEAAAHLYGESLSVARASTARARA